VSSCHRRRRSLQRKTSFAHVHCRHRVWSWESGAGGESFAAMLTTHHSSRVLPNKVGRTMDQGHGSAGRHSGQAVTNATNASPASSVSEFSSSFNLGNSPSSTSDSPSSTVVVANERAPRQAHRPRKRFCIAERPQKLAPPCAVGLVVPLCRYGGSLVLEIKILHRRQYRPAYIEKLCCGRYVPVKVFQLQATCTDKAYIPVSERGYILTKTHPELNVRLAHLNLRFSAVAKNCRRCGTERVS